MIAQGSNEGIIISLCDKITLKFDDGEKMIGYTQHLDFGPKGYFITPADVNGNNTHVFASKSAINSMSFF